MSEVDDVVKGKLTGLLDNFDYEINKLVNMWLSESIDSIEYQNRKNAIEDLFVKELRKLCQ